MNRRNFVVHLAQAGIGSSLLGGGRLWADAIRVDGDFGFSLEHGKLKMSARDVVIDGLSLPKFTWGWIGMGVAQGVLSALGGAIFGAIADAIFGTGKSTEQLLQEQLVAIAKLIDEKLTENDFRDYRARVTAFVSLFQEYSENPRRGLLDYLIAHSAETLAELESLEFIGYRTFMIGAGLRLSVLQEVINKHPTNGTRANFSAQVNRAVAFHNTIVDKIEKQTDVETYRQALLEKIRHTDFGRAATSAGLPEAMEQHAQNGQFTIIGPILGVQPQNLPRLQVNALTDQVTETLRNLAVPLPGVVLDLMRNTFQQVTPGDVPQARDVDWTLLRQNLKRENTLIGQAMIRRWQCAGTGGTRVAGRIGEAACEATRPGDFHN